MKLIMITFVYLSSVSLVLATTNAVSLKPNPHRTIKLLERIPSVPPDLLEEHPISPKEIDFGGMLLPYRTGYMPLYPNAMSQEELYHVLSNQLHNIVIDESTTEINFTMEDKDENSYSHTYMYLASGQGLYRFNSAEWIYLVYTSYHDAGVDGVMMIDHNKNLYTIDIHPCIGVYLYSADKLEFDCLEDLLKTHCQYKMWKKYPNQKLQPTVTTPVESGKEQGTAAEL